MVRLISPYGPGGSNDISLRLLAEEFGRSLHQQFIVENKPGAGTRIANDLVAHAPGDGYTILYVAAPYATAEALFGKLTYDRKDLRPVAMAVIAPLFLIISAEAPFKTLPDLIAYGKSSGRTDLRLTRRRLAAASCRRAPVQGCRRQGSQHPVPR
ncbi:hypothetical protein NK6_9975 [Bradyrhizobium diazoefficiens]|uniref:Tripartite tricarboxylate transporter substrate binding protein n=1 Tax=Bradyrhizobium diazoefficiens TaxID=1355477 RepID=A0A0E4BWX5_9BRAD|nr:hypothetical protein NK6_9975 [Bradyrhizobium diazoefficiens]